MTIPSRPAPAPPGSRSQNEIAGANASLEQLRRQLQQQHQQQQQTGNGFQKLTIKLPPPPKGVNCNDGGFSPYQKKTTDNNNGSSITRKFPQARYTPATSWDDMPFDSTTNGNAKKVPPPRPPPPKLQVNGRKATGTTMPPVQSTNIISSIFNRKKVTANTTQAAAASKATTQTRLYGVSSGNSFSSNNLNSINNTNANWNANWNSTLTNYSATSVYSTTSTTSTATCFGSSIASATNVNAASTTQEAQLISFDSPPSSPTFTQKSNSDCLSVDSFSSDSNFSSPNNGSVSQPESGFEDDFAAARGGLHRSRPTTTSPLDPWETLDAFSTESTGSANTNIYGSTVATIGTAPVRNLNSINNQRHQSTNQLENPLCNGKSLLPPAQSLAMPTIIKPKISQKPKAPKPPVFAKPNYGLDSNLPTPPSPPMPQFTPPVLSASGVATGGISLIDVISGKVDALQLSAGSSGYVVEPEQPYGLALYDFDGVEEGDLSFRENDKIYLLEQASEEWYRGRTRAGCEGIFPANYIDIKVPLASSSSSVSSTTAATTSNVASNFYNQYSAHPTSVAAASTTAHCEQFPIVRCLYNFPAEVEGDLALRENELVKIIYKINEDWLYGESTDGRQGQFPTNFLEYTPDNIPLP